MIRFASIAMLATLAAWPVPSMAQNLPLPTNPNIMIDYIEPRWPDDPQDKNYAKAMAAYQREVKIYQRLKKRQVLEELSAFLSPLKLPRTLRVRTKSCGVVNAFYEPPEWTVNMCYEWIDSTEQMAPQATSEGFTRQEVVVGGFVGVILHELGHAVSDMYQLPVLGREEDSADQKIGRAHV